jgi:hypothetical protein
MEKEPHCSRKQPVSTTLNKKLMTQTKQKQQEPKTKEQRKKWATFTYHTVKVRTITNILKNTDIKIAFKTTNTIQQRTKTRSPNTTHELERSGVNKMTCKTCNKAYIGQTSRNFTIRCREHITYIKYNQPQSAYAQHILRNIHEYGTPTETITLLKPVKPDTVLIPYEQLFIKAYRQTGNLVPEQNSNETNPLFQLIIDCMPPPT